MSRLQITWNLQEGLGKVKYFKMNYWISSNFRDC